MATKGYRQGFAAVFVVSALLLSGCHLVSGGGWILSSVDGKATFGFNGHCRLEVISDTLAYWFYEGQFQYMDKGAGVRFHADIAPFWGVFPEGSVVSCKTAASALGNSNPAILNGTYRQQPGGGTGGIFINVTDLGEPGINGDRLCVSLTGGPYHGYSNCGTIQGGNLQVQ